MTFSLFVDLELVHTIAESQMQLLKSINVHIQCNVTEQCYTVPVRYGPLLIPQSVFASMTALSTDTG